MYSDVISTIDNAIKQCDKFTKLLNASKAISNDNMQLFVIELKHINSFVVHSEETVENIFYNWCTLLKLNRTIEAINTLLSKLDIKISYLRLVETDMILLKSVSAILKELDPLTKEIFDRDVLYAFQQDTDSVELFASLSQQLINEYFLSNKMLVFHIMQRIEEAKDSVLKKKVKIIVNYPIHLSLIPVTESMTLSNLSNKVYSAAYSGSNVEKFARARGIGILLFTSHMPQAIEYNTLRLTDREQVAKYKTFNNSAPTASLIEQYKMLEILGENKKISFEYDVYNKSAETFLILESIYTDHYRVLLPWQDNKKFTVQKFRIEQMLSHLQGIPRFISYNYALADKIIPHLFTDKPVDYDMYEDSLSEIPVDKIYNELFHDVRVLRGKSRADKYDFLHSDQLQNTITNSLIRIFKLPLYAKWSTMYKSNAYPFGEFYSSFIISLNELVSQIVRDIHAGYLKNRDADVLELIEEVVQVLITPRTNIYASMHLKYTMLNMSNDVEAENIKLPELD